VSDLSFVEKSKLEKLLGMSSGYVLDFSNRTFQEFVVDSVRRDIYCGKYNYSSSSKANLLRRFWEIEPNHVVGKVVSNLVELAKDQSHHRNNSALLDECRRIADRLLQSAPVEQLDAIGEELAEGDFERLFRSIRISIDNNEPETGLDRLHTFATKFLRRVCGKRGITVSKDKPLHSLLGEYIKRLKADGAIETQMTERILKSSIANFEAFNFVRNEHSFAHDNSILNYEESLLVFSNVTSTIRFIQALEQKQNTEDDMADEVGYDDIPF